MGVDVKMGVWKLAMCGGLDGCIEVKMGVWRLAVCVED